MSENEMTRNKKKSKLFFPPRVKLNKIEAKSKTSLVFQTMKGMEVEIGLKTDP